MGGGPVSDHTVIRLVAAEPDLKRPCPPLPPTHWWQSEIKPPGHPGLITHAVWEADPLQSLPFFSPKTNPRCV